MLRESGKEVVLKVLKPGVEDVLATDLDFLYLASRVLEFINPELSRASLAAIVGDIRACMLEEVGGTPDDLLILPCYSIIIQGRCTHTLTCSHSYLPGAKTGFTQPAVTLTTCEGHGT